MLRAWMQVSILQGSGHEKKLARCKINTGATELAGQATNDRELSARCNFAWRAEIPFLDFKQFVLNQ